MFSKSELHLNFKRVMAVTLACALLVDTRWAAAAERPAVVSTAAESIFTTNALMSRILWLRNSPATTQRKEANGSLRALGWLGGVTAVSVGAASLWQMAQQTVQTVASAVVHPVAHLVVSTPGQIVVQAGQTLSGLFGFKNVHAIAHLNTLADPNKIKVGDVLQTGKDVFYQLPTMNLPNPLADVTVYQHPIIHSIVTPVATMVQHVLGAIGPAVHQITQHLFVPETLWIAAAGFAVAGATLLWKNLKLSKRQLGALGALGMFGMQTINAEQAANAQFKVPDAPAIVRSQNIDGASLITNAAEQNAETQNLMDKAGAAKDKLSGFAPHVKLGWAVQGEQGSLAANGQMVSIGPTVDFLFHAKNSPSDRASGRDSDTKALIAKVDASKDYRTRLLAVVKALVSHQVWTDIAKSQEDLKPAVQAITDAAEAPQEDGAPRSFDPILLQAPSTLEREITASMYEAMKAADAAQQLGQIPVRPGSINLRTAELTPQAMNALVQTALTGTPQTANGKTASVAADPEITRGVLDLLTAVQTSQTHFEAAESSIGRRWLPSDLDLKFNPQTLANNLLNPAILQNPAFYLGLINPTWTHGKKVVYKDEADALKAARDQFQQSDINKTFSRIHRVRQLIKSSYETSVHADKAITAARAVMSNDSYSLAERAHAVQTINENLKRLADARILLQLSQVIALGLGFTPDQLNDGMKDATAGAEERTAQVDADRTLALVRPALDENVVSKTKAFDDYLKKTAGKKGKKQKDARAVFEQSLATLSALATPAADWWKPLIASETASPEATLAVAADENGAIPDFTTTGAIDGAPDATALPAPAPFYARTDPSGAWTKGYKSDAPLYSSPDAAAIGQGWTGIFPFTITPTFNKKKMKKVQAFYIEASKNAQAALDDEKANAALWTKARAAIEYHALADQIKERQDQIASIEKTWAFDAVARTALVESLKTDIGALQSRRIQLEQEQGVMSVEFDADGLPKGLKPLAIFQADFEQLNLASSLSALNEKQYKQLPLAVGQQVNVNFFHKFKPNALFSFFEPDVSGLLRQGVQALKRKPKVVEPDLATVGARLQAEQHILAIKNGLESASQFTQVATRNAFALHNELNRAIEIAQGELSVDALRTANQNVAIARTAFEDADTLRRKASYDETILKERAAYLDFIFKTPVDSAEFKKAFGTTPELQQAVLEYRGQFSNVWLGNPSGPSFDVRSRKYQLDLAQAKAAADPATLVAPTISGLSYGPFGAVTIIPPTGAAYPTPMLITTGGRTSGTINVGKRSKVSQQAFAAKTSELKAADATTAATAEAQAPVVGTNAAAAAELDGLRNRLEILFTSTFPSDVEAQKHTDYLLSSLTSSIEGYHLNGVPLETKTNDGKQSQLVETSFTVHRVPNPAAFAAAIVHAPSQPGSTSAPGRYPMAFDAFAQKGLQADVQTMSYGGSLTGPIPDIRHHGLVNQVTKTGNALDARLASVADRNFRNETIVMANEMNRLQASYPRAQLRLNEARANLLLFESYYERKIVSASEFQPVVNEAINATKALALQRGRLLQLDVQLTQRVGVEAGVSPDIRMAQLGMERVAFGNVSPAAPTVTLPDTEIKRRLYIGELATTIFGSTGDRLAREQLGQFLKTNGLDAVIDDIPAKQFGAVLASLTPSGSWPLNYSDSTSPFVQFRVFEDQMHLARAMAASAANATGAMTDAVAYQWALRHPLQIQRVYDQNFRAIFELAKNIEGNDWRNRDVQNRWYDAVMPMTPIERLRLKATAVSLNTTEGTDTLQRLAQKGTVDRTTALLSASAEQYRWLSLQGRSRWVSNGEATAQLSITSSFLTMTNNLHTPDGKSAALSQNRLTFSKVLSGSTDALQLALTARTPKGVHHPTIGQIAGQIAATVATMSPADLTIVAEGLPAQRNQGEAIDNAQMVALGNLMGNVAAKTSVTLLAVNTHAAKAVRKASAPRKRLKIPAAIRGVAPALALFAVLMGMPKGSDAQTVTVTESVAPRPDAPLVNAPLNITWQELMAYDKLHAHDPPQDIAGIRAHIEWMRVWYKDTASPLVRQLNDVVNKMNRQAGSAANVTLAAKVPVFKLIYQIQTRFPADAKDLWSQWESVDGPEVITRDTRDNFDRPAWSYAGPLPSVKEYNAYVAREGKKLKVVLPAESAIDAALQGHTPPRTMSILGSAWTFAFGWIFAIPSLLSKFFSSRREKSLEHVRLPTTPEPTTQERFFATAA